jgi:hypothetical protein
MNGYKQLYYIGNIEQPAQLRVSLVDNNKELPTNSLYWTDSFRISTDNDYKSKITSNAKDSIKNIIDTHINNYHLPGMSVSQLTSTYLKTDFSNVSQEQQYVTHALVARKNKDYGFDTIVKYKNNGKRWFRLWKSGLLEHGGIITSSTTTQKYINVSLAWTYDGSKSAPIYDYSIVYDGFYGESYTLSPNGSKLDINA